MTELIFSVTERDEGGFCAQAVGESIFTEANTPSELRRMVRDAVRCHFDEDELPSAVRLRFSRDDNPAFDAGLRSRDYGSR